MSPLKLDLLFTIVVVLTIIALDTIGFSFIGGSVIGAIIGMLAFWFGDDEVGIKTYRSLRYDEPYAVLASYPIRAAFTEYYFRKWQPVPDTIFLLQERNYGRSPFLVAARWGSQSIPNFVIHERDRKGLVGLN